jgi:DNA-binding NarL/FixJ family response regulator
MSDTATSERAAAPVALVTTLPLSIHGRRQIAEATLREVIRGRGMALSHIASNHRWPEYVTVRKEAAQKLYAMGFKRCEIGRLLGRDPSTVWYYLLSPSERGRENRVRIERAQHRRKRDGQML